MRLNDPEVGLGDEELECVEDQGRVTGFISRYGELDSDRGVFLDQFFKQGKLDGNRLSFSTQTVHGTWYEFKGTVERGDGKNPGDEAYYVLKGVLTQYTSDANQKTSSKSREVAFKLFPKDMGSGPEKPEKKAPMMPPGGGGMGGMGDMDY